MQKSPESFTFTVGKLDAGMAILIGERAHLIEFPSILLPPGATTGSIVSIAVNQDHVEEKRRDTEFWSLQDDIMREFGTAKPQTPELQLRHTTQTSVTLEWPPVVLATAKLRSLDIYRNGERLASIPSPLTNTSTKLSGLQTDEDYTFQLILRTSAGTFPSNLIRVRTHTMQDTSGISVCFGTVEDEVLLENAKMALREMKAKWSDKIQIDTTHFICTTPAATSGGAQATGSAVGAPGVEYQRALQLSIPVLYPEWIIACHSEKRMVPIGAFDLKSERTVPTGTGRSQSLSQVNVATTPDSASARNRASMPPPVRSPSSSDSNSIPPAPHSTPATKQTFAPTPEEPEPDAAEGGEAPTDTKRKSRSGTMNREFRFPSPVSSPVVPDAPMSLSMAQGVGVGVSGSPPPMLQGDLKGKGMAGEEGKFGEEGKGAGEGKTSTSTSTSVEVPPPPPVEKERSNSSLTDDGDDEVGDTVEVDLS